MKSGLPSGADEYFDLSALLEQDDLKVRQLASKYAFSAKEYFNILSNFLRLAPDVSNALRRFANQEGDKEAYRSLDEMATLLNELRYDKYVSTFYTILEAFETDNWRLAAFHAERTMDDFNKFYAQIKAAITEKTTEAVLDNRLPLKEYIKLFDEEERNRKMIILAVDDSPVVLKSVSSVLCDVYKVYTLPKPTELEKILQRLTPDLFLLDYQMPEINGFELIPIIRSFKEHKDTPIVFLTSQGTIDTLTAAIALGACDFVVKPFNPDVLRERIKKALAKKCAKLTIG